MLLPFPFRCKPLSKSGEEPRLWSVDGPGEPEKGRRGIIHDAHTAASEDQHSVQPRVTSINLSFLAPEPQTPRPVHSVKILSFVIDPAVLLGHRTSVVRYCRPATASRRCRSCCLMRSEPGVKGAAFWLGHAHRTTPGFCCPIISAKVKQRMTWLGNTTWNF